MARMAIRMLAAAALFVAAPAVAQVCGDAVCLGPGETQCNCPVDCGASSTDGCCRVTGTTGDNCNADPVACACPGGTGPCMMLPSPPAPPNLFRCTDCGDGMCLDGETACNCPDLGLGSGDCLAACGDGCCTSGEDANTCPADCLSWCGNLVCEPGEDDCSCADEGCGVTCGDGMCCAAGGESPSTCAADCSVCGDDLCTGTEDCAGCAADCECTGDEVCRTDLEPPVCAAPGKCGDEECAGETCVNCPADCGECTDAGTPDGDGGNEGEAEAEGEVPVDGVKNLYACDCSIGARPGSMTLSLALLALCALSGRRFRTRS